LGSKLRVFAHRSLQTVCPWSVLRRPNNAFRAGKAATSFKVPFQDKDVKKRCGRDRNGSYLGRPARRPQPSHGDTRSERKVTWPLPAVVTLLFAMFRGRRHAGGTPREGVAESAGGAAQCGIVCRAAARRRPLGKKRGIHASQGWIIRHRPACALYSLIKDDRTQKELKQQTQISANLRNKTKTYVNE